MPKSGNPQPQPKPAPATPHPPGHRTNPWPTVRIDSLQLFWVIVLANLTTAVITGIVVALLTYES